MWGVVGVATQRLARCTLTYHLPRPALGALLAGGTLRTIPRCELRDERRATSARFTPTDSAEEPNIRAKLEGVLDDSKERARFRAEKERWGKQPLGARHRPSRYPRAEAPLGAGDAASCCIERPGLQAGTCRRAHRGTRPGHRTCIQLTHRKNECRGPTRRDVDCAGARTQKRQAQRRVEPGRSVGSPPQIGRTGDECVRRCPPRRPRNLRPHRPRDGPESLSRRRSLSGPRCAWSKAPRAPLARQAPRTEMPCLATTETTKGRRARDTGPVRPHRGRNGRGDRLPARPPGQSRPPRRRSCLLGATAFQRVDRFS